MRSGRTQFGRSARASSPTMKNISAPGCSALSVSSVSAVYDGPARSTSRVATSYAASLPTASRSIATRCSSEVIPRPAPPPPPPPPPPPRPHHPPNPPPPPPFYTKPTPPPPHLEPSTGRLRPY